MYNAKEIKSRIKSELREQGRDPYKTSIALGFAKGTLDNSSMPSSELIATFADYLEVSADYLLGRPEKPAHLSDLEIMLLSAFNQCSDADKKSLLDLAELYASRNIVEKKKDVASV